MKTAECACGNTFEYKTIRNKIKCQKCGGMVPAEPSTVEEMNPPEVEEGEQE